MKMSKKKCQNEQQCNFKKLQQNSVNVNFSAISFTFCLNTKAFSYQLTFFNISIT